MSFDTIFYNVAFVGAFLVAAYGLMSLKSSENWIKTTGIIEKLEAKKEFTPSSSTQSDSVDYPVDLVYSFKVNGITHKGGSIYAGLPSVFSSLNELEKFMKDYKIDQEIELFYDADDPKKSALMQPGVSTFGYVILWLMLFGIAGIMFFVLNKLL